MSTSGANTNGKKGKFPHVLEIIPSCFLTPTFVGLQTLKIDLIPTFTFVCIFSRQTQFSSVSFFLHGSIPLMIMILLFVTMMMKLTVILVMMMILMVVNGVLIEMVEMMISCSIMWMVEMMVGMMISCSISPKKKIWCQGTFTPVSVPALGINIQHSA